MFRRRTSEDFIDSTQSILLEEDTGNVNWRYVFILAFDAIVTFAAGLMIVLAFKFALYGRLNQGIVTSLFSLTSIYLAFFSYFAFNERLHFFHFVGIASMVA